MVAHVPWHAVATSNDGASMMVGTLTMANTLMNSTLIHSGALKVSPKRVIRTQSIWNAFPNDSSAAVGIEVLEEVDLRRYRLSNTRKKEQVGRSIKVIEDIKRTLIRWKSKILHHWKTLLPVIWVLLAASPFSNLSPTHLLASFAVAFAPLLKSNAPKNFQPKLALHQFIRDSGLFATMMDAVLLLSLPAVVIQQPTVLADFWRMGSQRKRIVYGVESPKQVLDMYVPTEREHPRGLVFFVVSEMPL